MKNSVFSGCLSQGGLLLASTLCLTQELVARIDFRDFVFYSDEELWADEL